MSNRPAPSCCHSSCHSSGVAHPLTPVRAVRAPLLLAAAAGCGHAAWSSAVWLAPSGRSPVSSGLWAVWRLAVCASGRSPGLRVRGEREEKISGLRSPALGSGRSGPSGRLLPHALFTIKSVTNVKAIVYLYRSLQRLPVAYRSLVGPILFGRSEERVEAACKHAEEALVTISRLDQRRRRVCIAAGRVPQQQRAVTCVCGV